MRNEEDRREQWREASRRRYEKKRKSQEEKRTTKTKAEAEIISSHPTSSILIKSDENTHPEAEARRKKEKRSAPLDPRVKEVCSVMWETWKRRHGVEPANYPKLLSAANRLMKTMAPENVLLAWDRFLDERETFYADHGWGKFPTWLAAHRAMVGDHEPAVCERTR